MRKLYLILFTVVFFQLTSLFSQSGNPTIGIAFGGGGAKGFAHIGVLKVLEEANIRPDYIAGTSIGSIIGGLYAIGYSVEELERLALELNWVDYFSDELNRMDIPIEERTIAERYQLSLSLDSGRVSIPTGLIQGRKIGLLLSQLTLPAHGIDDFDEFNIPFRAVATDFETGQPVVLESGSLAKSMRASMSLPSIFEPAERDGQLLIDGGVARNLPVEEVKAMGAGFVIGLDITSPLYSKEDLTSLLDVVEQTGSYKLSESVKASKDLADVVIHPEIDEYGTLDFDKGKELIALGEKAAREKLPEILKLIRQKKGLPRQKLLIPESYRIEDITINGNKIDEKQQKLGANLVQVNPLKEYSIEKIEDRIQKLFGSQFFTEAYYEFQQTEEGYQLNIDAKPQSGEYVQVSANYDSNLKAGLLLNTTFRNRGFNGSKFSIDLKLSENPVLLADYLVYTASRPNIGLHLGLKLNHYPALFFDEEGDLNERLGIRHYELRTDLFSGVTNRYLVSVGIGLEQYSQRRKFFDKDTEDLRLSQAVVYLGLLRDTYDREEFPRDGSYLSLNGKFAFSSRFRQINEDRDDIFNSFNEFIRLSFSNVYPIGERFAIKWYNDAGYINFETDNYLNLFYLGRSIPGELTHIEFVGLDYTELPVTTFIVSGLKFRAEPKANIFTSLLFNYGYYRVNEFTLVDEDQSTLVPSTKGNLWGIGGEFGWYTPLGPIRATAEYNLKEARANFSLHLGYTF